MVPMTSCGNAVVFTVCRCWAFVVLGTDDAGVDLCHEVLQTHVNAENAVFQNDFGAPSTKARTPGCTNSLSQEKALVARTRQPGSSSEMRTEDPAAILGSVRNDLVHLIELPKCEKKWNIGQKQRAN